MKAYLAILGVLAMTSTGFAASKGSDTLNDLVKIGIKASSSKNEIRVAIQDADCGESLHTGAVECTVTDMGANGGKQLTLQGSQAESLMVTLYRNGGIGDEGMGKSWMSLKSLECTQTSAKTTCTSKAE